MSASDSTSVDGAVWRIADVPARTTIEDDGSVVIQALALEPDEAAA